MSASDRGPDPQTEILVNGKKIPANTFVQEFMGETVIGMVRKLKRTDDEIKTVQVTVTCL